MTFVLLSRASAPVTPTMPKAVKGRAHLILVRILLLPLEGLTLWLRAVTAFISAQRVTKSSEEILTPCQAALFGTSGYHRGYGRANSRPDEEARRIKSAKFLFDWAASPANRQGRQHSRGALSVADGVICAADYGLLFHRRS